LVGELTELLERFGRGAELAVAVATGAEDAELDYHPAPGTWSVREIVNHLCDAEIVAVERFRRIIAEENPTILVYDQEAWVKRLDYHRRRLSQSLETFRRMRSENHELLKDLPAATFQRVGTHSVRGSVTLFDLLRTYTEHAEDHAQQISRAREAYQQSPATA
jgi:uncharacterized damage-inducible protein DinB